MYARPKKARVRSVQIFLNFLDGGMSLRAHPLSFYREEMNQLRIAPAAELPQLRDGQFVRVAGLVLVRQRPSTAKGITFVTLEDETGLVNLVIRPNIWERYYKIARTSPAWVAASNTNLKDPPVPIPRRQPRPHAATGFLQS